MSKRPLNSWTTGDRNSRRSLQRLLSFGGELSGCPWRKVLSNIKSGSLLAFVSEAGALHVRF